MALLLFFALAIIADLLTVIWHKHRESKRVWSTSLISMGLEVLSWLPLWAAIKLDDPWVAAASILGSGVGTAVGLSRHKGCGAPRAPLDP